MANFRMLLCACAFGYVALATEEATCSAAGGLGCLPLDEDASLHMLQHDSKALMGAAKKLQSAKSKRDDVDEVWDQLSGAVSIDCIQNQISSAMGNSTHVAELQAQLEKLQAQFPDADAIKEQFQDHWNEIKVGFDEQKIMQQIQSATGDVKNQLQAQLEELQKAYPNLSVESIKDQAAEMWSDLQDKLPNLDEVTAKAREMAEKYGDALADFSANFNVTDVVGDITDKFGDLTDAVTDKVGDIAGNISGAWNNIFR